MLSDSKRDFISFMLECQVLRFGDFVTKSGRQTPFFVNTGHYDNGDRLRRLGQFYAKTMVDAFGDGFDLIYGPAYKGIPLAVTTSVALAELYGRAVPIAFNRKEAKDHGEGGALVGHPIEDGQRVVIIDDVVTAGTSVRESVQLLTAAARVELTGLVVSVDRQERGKGELSALQEVHQAYGMKAVAIATLDDIVAYLQAGGPDDPAAMDATLLERIEAYRAQYGVR